jgi:hypothetical protein
VPPVGEAGQASSQPDPAPPAVCGPLARIDSDDHVSHADVLQTPPKQQPWRACLIQVYSGSAFLEPHHGPDTTSWHLVNKPSQPTGRRFASPAHRILERYDHAQRTSRVCNQTVRCASPIDAPITSVGHRDCRFGCGSAPSGRQSSNRLRSTGITRIVRLSRWRDVDRGLATLLG